MKTRRQAAIEAGTLTVDQLNNNNRDDVDDDDDDIEDEDIDDDYVEDDDDDKDFEPDDVKTKTKSKAKTKAKSNKTNTKTTTTSTTSPKTNKVAKTKTPTKQSTTIQSPTSKAVKAAVNINNNNNGSSPSGKLRRSSSKAGKSTGAGSSESVQYEALSEDQQAEIKEAFNLFKNDNGQLDINQIKYAFRALGVEAEKHDLDALRNSSNGGNKDQLVVRQCIPFASFKDVAAKLLPRRDSHSSIEQAFKLFDKDASGKISFEDLKLVAVNLGEECSEEDLREMIEFADVDGDGEVNKADFINLMTSTRKVF
ncbi:hypothetical protein SAMD00019534_088100 [Acytostelium subglobosum LB1]|uniref:hypothetical protein n=1 Tax=Acytostelium subglobosum LB1 TaxID=1410327 RepID=UPI000645018B|nr:hypothetical protein SAMD00019534_088100 [Acytostelium subglobosum LB1]GAM25635.1 hypothetical protein SAMD00019534_088100 [Acytostelium subglobosum LB1]|eukprot:XP_012751621.1 hypothetical protein SAMD00019534_088100 [Acytostelium subglobosum LB1]